jgi:dTDP-4-dehydrorhamnose reductase
MTAKDSDAMRAMRILVTGAQGQLARALVDCAPLHPNLNVVALGRPELDLRDETSIARAVAAVAPGLVVNAAAYTAVDKAESDIDAAFAVNGKGAGAVARAAAAHGCPVIHVSTDYVFDGRAPAPYLETDAPNPNGVYGRSKLAGEAVVAFANPRHVILRTAWVYGAHGHNFLKTILRLARERPELAVVADQHGNPTYAPHLARIILAIAARLADGAPREAWGVFHAAGSGATTWHGFAAAIVAAGSRLGLVPQVPVHPIPTDAYPTPARRPANSRLDCGKLDRVWGLRLPEWPHGLEECIAKLAADTTRLARPPIRTAELAHR